MSNHALAYLLLIFSAIVLTKAREVTISETCTAKTPNFGKWPRNVELSRPWTLNSSLTIVVTLNGSSSGFLEVGISGASKNFSRTLFCRISRRSRRSVVSCHFTKNIGEYSWTSELYEEGDGEREQFNLTITRHADYFQIKVNGQNVRALEDNDHALRVHRKDLYANKIFIITSKPVTIRSVCFWNTTNVMQQGSIILDRKVYSVKESENCVAGGQEDRFPDTLKDLYLGHSFTDNNTITFVGKVHPHYNVLNVALSHEETTSTELFISLNFGLKIAFFEKAYNLKNKIWDLCSFPVDYTENDFFSLTIVRRGTFYEIILNETILDISKEIIKVVPGETYNKFSINDGGRMIRNICSWKNDESVSTNNRTTGGDYIDFYDEIDEGFEENILAHISLNETPVGVVVPECLEYPNCTECFLYTSGMGGVRAPCLKLLEWSVPAFVLVNDKCKFISAAYSKPKIVNIQLCFDAIYLKTKNPEFISVNE